MTANLVSYPPLGLIIALQYWQGDEAEAMRLARLIADIEPMRRDDVTIAFCRRYDCPQSTIAARAFDSCATKFRVMTIRSNREGKGHPQGCNELWSSVMEQLSASWQAGNLSACSVMTIEHDGVPMSVDWIDRLRAEHGRALRAGKRVSGCVTDAPIVHVNGTLIAHLSMWRERLSLHHTPQDQAWDLFHGMVLMSETQPTTLIKNIYGGTKWSDESLAAMARETAWISSIKDDSAIRWAERTLVTPLPDERTRAWMS